MNVIVPQLTGISHPFAIVCCLYKSCPTQPFAYTFLKANGSERKLFLPKFLSWKWIIIKGKDWDGIEQLWAMLEFYSCGCHDNCLEFPYKATVYLVMLDNQFIHPRPADEAHAVTG